jgi:hypothetical protein
MWLVDFADSITLPFILLVASLTCTQWMLSHTRLRKNHPALQEPTADFEAERRRHAMFELPRQPTQVSATEIDRAVGRNIALELEIAAARRRLPGI